MMIEKFKGKGVGRRILLTVMLILLVSIFLFGERGLVNWYKLQRLEEQLEVANDSLKTEIDDLTGSIQAIEQGDTLELERVARHWGMVRPGEEVYVVREEDDTVQTTP